MAFRRNTRGEKLPDVLVPGLDVVFVGTAPSRRSAAVGAITPIPATASGRRSSRPASRRASTSRMEYPQLIHLGIGFTDMAKRASGMDHEIDPGLFEVERFEEEMRRCRPRAVAFTSKKAASVWMGAADGAHSIWPAAPRSRTSRKSSSSLSPSGAGRRSWSIEPWAALARFLGRAKS